MRTLQMDPTFGCLLNLCMIALEKINRIVFHYSEGFANSTENDAELRLPPPAPLPHPHADNKDRILIHVLPARCQDQRVLCLGRQTHRPTRCHTNRYLQDSKGPLPKPLILWPLNTQFYWVFPGPSGKSELGCIPEYNCCIPAC